jgi:hypothetical protein
MMNNNNAVTGLRVAVNGDDSRQIDLTGRDAWAAHQLIEAGDVGCTPINNPAPRWSHYVWKLRGQGIDVETITEPHGGAYSGSHARYVLKTPLRIIEAEREEDMRGAT